MGVAVHRNRYKSIVSLLLSILALLAFNYSDQTGLNHATRKCRRIHQQQNISRIAIIGLRRRNKTKIVGKGHSVGKHAVQSEGTQVGIELVLVSTTLRRLDHHVDS